MNLHEFAMEIMEIISVYYGIVVANMAMIGGYPQFWGLRTPQRIKQIDRTLIFNFKIYFSIGCHSLFYPFWGLLYIHIIQYTHFRTTPHTTQEIQSTAPANLLSALGLPEGHGFRGRGVIWAAWWIVKRIDLTL